MAQSWLSRQNPSLKQLNLQLLPLYRRRLDTRYVLPFLNSSFHESAQSFATKVPDLLFHHRHQLTRRLVVLQLLPTALLRKPNMDRRIIADIRDSVCVWCGCAVSTHGGSFWSGT